MLLFSILFLAKIWTLCLVNFSTKHLAAVEATVLYRLLIFQVLILSIMLHLPNRCRYDRPIQDLFSGFLTTYDRLNSLLDPTPNPQSGGPDLKI